jgi:hypothetical protein
MKKALFFSSIFCIFLASCSTTEQLAMSPLYTVSDDSIKDIHGTINISRLLISKEFLPGNQVVTLDKFIQEDETLFYITVRYLGSGWIFLKEIELKIDSDFVKLRDNNPSRTVGSGTGGDGVSEIINCLLDQENIQKLKNCDSLVIQYYYEPITISPAGIKAIKDFLD